MNYLGRHGKGNRDAPRGQWLTRELQKNELKQLERLSRVQN
jgi:hypothetical protein